MDHVRKMALIPADITDRLYQPVGSALQQPEKAFTQRAIQDMDMEMRSILDNDRLGEDEKLKMYSQLLQQRLRYHDKQAQPIPVPVQINKDDDNEDQQIAQDIITTLPANLQGKARRIIRGMKDHPGVIRWNKDWQLVYEGVPVLDTNIADLITDLVQKKRRTATTAPKGMSSMLQGLKKINIPPAFIENKVHKAGLIPPTPPSSPSTPPSLMRKVRPTLSAKRKTSVPYTSPARHWTRLYKS